MTTKTTHRARWFVYADGVMIPRQSTMRGQWGYDVMCSCGWRTYTGGAVKSYVDQELWHHKWSEGALSGSEGVMA